MPITPKNILAHEWIGLNVSIKESSDPTTREISGVVRNESRNTITIENADGTLLIAKSHTMFSAKLPSGEILTVNGNQLRHRPEDRVKKGLTKW
jgi:ribonuclease P protein subunit POP4